MAASVLVVDDEKDLRDLLTHHLERAGYSVLTADSGATAVQIARERTPDAIVLDIMLPDILGTDVLRTLRDATGTASIPVLCLTARGDEGDRVLGFELGADDYVVKPFSPRELVLRVQALLRRGTGGEGAKDTAIKTTLRRGGIHLDRNRHEVKIADEPLDLTPTEFNLLACLMENPGTVLSRERLLDLAWGSDVYVTDRTVDTHVKRLRSKLGRKADQIETVRGVGYRFRV